MDNDAFRALVNQQQNPKSTKEIAREAVENEFRLKRHKRGGGGGRKIGGGGAGGDYYDSDSSGSDDADADKNKNDGGDEGTTNEPEWKRRRRREQMGGGDRATLPVYRDRAKERREGKNLDYSGVASTTAATGAGIRSGSDDNVDNEDRKRRRAAAVELSKFLGGDEQHTHLVKGLDYALAQKVRREEMADRHNDEQGEGDLDQLLEDAYIQKNKNSVFSPQKSSSSLLAIQPKSELGKSVLNYLLQLQDSSTTATSSNLQSKIEINTTKQKSIQRSQLTFSLLQSNTVPPIDRNNAWEVPQLKIIGASVSSSLFGGHKNERGEGNKRDYTISMTPLDCHLIATIKKKLDDVNNNIDNNNKEVKKKGKVKVNNDSHSKGERRDEQQEEIKNREHEHSTKMKESHPTDTTNKSEYDDESASSDDDIFADVGAYIPPTAAVAPSESAAAAAATTTITTITSSTDSAPVAQPLDAATRPQQQKKQSIFDNLITADPKNTTTSPQNQLRSLQHLHRQGEQHHDAETRQLNQNRNVIDRNVFGGEGDRRKHDQVQTMTKRRGPQTAAMEGVSMSNYEGGYGEEMDVDFLNVDDDDEKYRRKMKRDYQGRMDRDDNDDEVDDEED